jgi:hypothetical protein
MPDEDDNKTADPTESPLHAYREGREGDVEGDVEKLKSGDPKESQRQEIEDESGDPADVVEPPEKA